MGYRISLCITLLYGNVTYNKRKADKTNIKVIYETIITKRGNYYIQYFEVYHVYITI